MAEKKIIQFHEMTNSTLLEADLQTREMGFESATKFLIFEDNGGTARYVMTMTSKAMTESGGNFVITGSLTSAGLSSSVSTGDVLSLNGTGTANTTIRFNDEGVETAAIYTLNGEDDLILRGKGEVQIMGGGGPGIDLRISATGVIGIPNLTASRAIFTDASKNLVSNAVTGTGNVVMSTSPTLTGTVVLDCGINLEQVLTYGEGETDLATARSNQQSVADKCRIRVESYTSTNVDYFSFSGLTDGDTIYVETTAGCNPAKIDHDPVTQGSSNVWSIPNNTGVLFCYTGGKLIPCVTPTLTT